MDKRWSLLIEKLRFGFVEAEKRYKTYIPLINFLDKEMLDIQSIPPEFAHQIKWISKDFSEFETMKLEIDQFKIKFESLVEEGKILDLLKQDDFYNETS